MPGTTAFKTFRQIGAELGISHVAAKDAFDRGMRKLRAHGQAENIIATLREAERQRDKRAPIIPDSQDE